MATLAHIAGTVAIDGTPTSRNIIVIKNDPSGYAVVGSGASESDGTFDIEYGDWDGAVIVLAIDNYGIDFSISAPLNVGAVVHPTTPNGYVYYVTISGTTGSTEPSWSIDGVVVSGGVTLAPQPYYRPIASGPINGDIIWAEPDPSDEYFHFVSLLLHCDSAPASSTFIDSGNSALTITPQGSIYPFADANFFKFGVTSIRVYGSTSSRLEVFNDGGLDLEGGNFTAEAWVKRNSSSSYGIIVGVWGASGAQQWMLAEVDGYLAFGWYIANNTYYELRSPAVVSISDTFHHVAVCRDGSTLMLFLDGTLIASRDIPSMWNPTGSPTGSIGASTGNLHQFDGWIDEIRVTKGVARYTASFTPSSEPFPDQGPE